MNALSQAFIVAQASAGSELLQLLVQGLALGAIYALIALGFVIIYKATEVINFAHGALMLVGAYLTYMFTTSQFPNPFGSPIDFPSFMSLAGLPITVRFPVAIALAAVIVGALGIVVERLILRRMVGQPVFAVVLITLGLEIVLATTVQVFWGPQQKSYPSPFPAGASYSLGSLSVQRSAAWTILVTVVLVLAFFAFFRFTKAGVALRATAFDQEAALAMGIKASTVFALAWAIGGILAAVAGALFVPTRVAGFLTIAPVRFSALRAFPAAILGGLDSPGGAVVGGAIIGVAEVLSSRYLSPIFFQWGFANFHLVFSFILMVVILLIRPYGLFGTKEVIRV